MIAELFKGVEAKTQTATYYAYSRKDEDKSNWQLLKDHLTNTANYASGR